jgi:hypothetical protein
MTPEQMKTLQFFTSKEILPLCPDIAKVDLRVLLTLECFRASVGLPMKITSLTEGDHVPGSLHYLGLAVDFRVITYGVAPSKIPSVNTLVEMMLDAGFRGIGHYPEYWQGLVFHGDIRGRVQLWTRLGGQYMDLVKNNP